MRTRKFVSRCAHVHMGIVQDKVLEVNQFAFQPERGTRVGKTLALEEAVPNGRSR